MEGQAYMVGAEADPSFASEIPIDTEMSYVVFEDSAGKPLAVIFNFGCHNNMVNRVLSADMFGRAGDVLREKLGDIATVSLAAPSGDVNFVGAGGKRLVRDDRAAGQAIADAILKSYAGVERRVGAGIQVASVILPLPPGLER